MRAYLGHFVSLPGDQFLALAQDFQEALDAVDMLGQADESSLVPVQDGFLLRVRLSQADEGLWIANARQNPVPIVTEDLRRLRDHPGTGPTGDTMRSYGPRCPKCGFQHFEEQECKAFLEPLDELFVTLLASPRRPGEGIIEVHGDIDLMAKTVEPDLVEVCLLGDYEFMGVFPFLLRDGRYDADEAEAEMDGDFEGLYAACREAGIVVPDMDLG